MKLTAQHHKAIELLAMGETNKSVSISLEVAQETVSRWIGDCDFSAALNGLIDENKKATQERLRNLSALALSTIEQVMTDDKTPPKDRLTAALKVIELAGVTVARVGSNDPAKLRQEREDDKFLDSLM